MNNIDLTEEEMEKRILTMMEDKILCEEIAVITNSNMLLPANFIKLPCSSHCFRVILPKNDMVKAISCSIPTDVNRGIMNRLREYQPLSIVYETALFDDDDHLIYIDELGYGDICRFDSDKELTNEVKRVMEEIEKIQKREKDDVDL